MTQNRELAVIAMAKELGRAVALGLDVSVPHPIRYRFFSVGETSDLARRLRSEGFDVYEPDDEPAVEARRSELLNYGSLETSVRGMCELAEKYAAEYDGLSLEN